MAVLIENVSHTFQSGSARVVALDDVSFLADNGEIVCIVGESGCGKTTLLNILAGFVSATAGRAIVHDDTRPHGIPVSYAFQRPRLLPWRTVSDNVRFALRPLGLSKDIERARVKKYLSMVQLDNFSGAYPATLSGGMQQRAAVARAFATEPAALLMDEPFGSLDEFTARSLRNELLELAAAQRQTIVFVTHNIAEATFLADRVIVMSPRPGRVKTIIPIELPRPRIQESAAFAAYQADILRALA